jgi:hypothetical protein
MRRVSVSWITTLTAPHRGAPAAPLDWPLASAVCMRRYRSYVSSDWYLNNGGDWTKFYHDDPLSYLPADATAAEKALVLGGEACMWNSAFAAGCNMDSATWPNAAAVAEALWSFKAGTGDSSSEYSDLKVRHAASTASPANAPAPTPRPRSRLLATANRPPSSLPLPPLPMPLTPPANAPPPPPPNAPSGAHAHQPATLSDGPARGWGGAGGRGPLRRTAVRTQVALVLLPGRFPCVARNAATVDAGIEASSHARCSQRRSRASTSLVAPTTNRGPMMTMAQLGGDTAGQGGGAGAGGSRGGAGAGQLASARVGGWRGNDAPVISYNR